MKTIRHLSAAFAAFVLIVCSLLAAPAAEQKASPAGSWTWTITPPNSGQSFESTLKLEIKDGKLTGVLNGRMGEAPITDAVCSPEGEISFTVVRERNGDKFTVKYAGKIDGDSIKGTIELPGWGGGDPRKMDWIATRVK